MENADIPGKGSVNIVKLLMVREKSVKYERTMSCAETVINAVRHMFDGIFREQVVVVGLDSRNYPNVLHINGVGSPNQSAVFIANIFRPLLLSNAVSCILVHNHIGNTMRPSSADTMLTDKVVEIGKLLEIPLLDHLIINSDGTEYFSFKKMGLIKD
jgi:DNA repair protein RadC